jgi:hypothetical protein
MAGFEVSTYGRVWVSTEACTATPSSSSRCSPTMGGPSPSTAIASTSSSATTGTGASTNNSGAPKTPPTSDKGLLIHGDLACQVEEAPDLLGSRGDLGAVIVAEDHRNAHADQDPADGNDHQELG